MTEIIKKMIQKTKSPSIKQLENDYNEKVEVFNKNFDQYKKNIEEYVDLESSYMNRKIAA